MKRLGWFTSDRRVQLIYLQIPLSVFVFLFDTVWRNSNNQNVAQTFVEPETGLSA